MIERQSQLMELAGRLGHSWNDISLLDTALRHSSFANQHGLPHNERAEFLGDSVLDLLCAELLMARHPEEREGFMSQQRANMIKGCTLATRARDIGLGSLIMVGRGAEYLRDVDSVLADALEAVVGTAFMDGGLPAARQVAHNAGIL